MTDINQSIVDPVANNAQPTNKAEDDDKKVFAGNLAFATTEQQLKTLFSEAGNVTHAQIITRGTRSLGYGFVTFSTQTEAQTAIQLLNKRDVDGREISVESAKPQSAVTAADADKPKPRRTRSKKGKESSRAPRRARADEGEEGAAEEDAAKAATDADAPTDVNGTKPSKSAKRRQKKKAAAAAAAAAAVANGETAAPADAPTDAKAEPNQRAPRAKREPKGKPQGEPSKTLVFVANLAFATTDDSLKAAFSDYKVKSAHVVKRRNGNRSKGFGFVDFEDASEQQRAIASAQGKQIDGRDVTLQVAVQNDKADQQAQAAEPAPAAA